LLSGGSVVVFVNSEKVVAVFNPSRYSRTSPRFLEIANFVLDTGTTSFAHTNPAAMHSKTTDPMPMKRDGSGATASNVCDGALFTEFTIDESATVNVFEVMKSGETVSNADSDWWEDDPVEE